jgi:DNA-binding transcriptional MerR regulator
MPNPKTTAPAETDQKSPKETWYDWFPNERVEDGITLEELLEEAAAADMASYVNPVTLSNWQTRGFIPYPTRKWRDGATRAIFPRRAIAVLVELITLQHSGLPLQEIGARLRGAAAITSYPDPEELRDKLTGLAFEHGKVTGRRITSVEVRFTDEHGRVDTYEAPGQYPTWMDKRLGD